MPITKHSARRQRTQIGTSSPTKRLSAWATPLQFAGEYVKSKPMGYKVGTANNLSTESGVADWEAEQACYNQVWYAAAGHMHLGAITNLGGTPTAYGWTAKIQPDALDAPQAFVITHGSDYGARKALNALVAAFGLQFGRDKVGMSAKSISDALAVEWSDGLDPEAQRIMTVGINTIFQSVLAGTDGTTTFTFTTASPLPAGTTAPITLAASDQSAAIRSALEAILGTGEVEVSRTATRTYQIELIGKYAQTAYATPAQFSGAAAGGTSPSNTVTRPQVGVPFTRVPLKTILPQDWYVQVVTAYADLATAPGLAGAVAALEFESADKWNNYWAANTDTTLGKTDPSGQVEDDVNDSIVLRLFYEHPAVRQFVRRMRKGSTVFVRVTARSQDVISGANYPKLVLTMCCQVGEVVELGPEGKVFGAKIPLTLVVCDDGSAFNGETCVLDGVNVLASL